MARKIPLTQPHQGEQNWSKEPLIHNRNPGQHQGRNQAKHKGDHRNHRHTEPGIKDFRVDAQPIQPPQYKGMDQVDKQGASGYDPDRLFRTLGEIAGHLQICQEQRNRGHKGGERITVQKLVVINTAGSGRPDGIGCSSRRKKKNASRQCQAFSFSHFLLDT